MRIFLIAMASVTYALKAQNMLRDRGFDCSVRRTPKNPVTGCTYAIQVRIPSSDLKKVLDLLQEKNISAADISELGFAGGE